MLAALHGLAQHASIGQVECLWEPYMILAARIRESFGLPGMTVEETWPFRDKERMKTEIDSRRDPYAMARQRDDGGRGVGGGGAGGLSAHRQADRREPARPTPTGWIPRRS